MHLIINIVGHARLRNKQTRVKHSLDVSTTARQSPKHYDGDESAHHGLTCASSIAAARTALPARMLPTYCSNDLDAPNQRSHTEGHAIPILTLLQPSVQLY
jgi:hypothetical protein